MFEGKIPSAEARTPHLGVKEQGSELRPVSWGDLVARLAAARELRSALHEELHGEGSFDPDSARRIAARGECKAGVNPEDLVNGKVPGARYRSSAGAMSGEPRK